MGIDHGKELVRPLGRRRRRPPALEVISRACRVPPGQGGIQVQGSRCVRGPGDRGWGSSRLHERELLRSHRMQRGDGIGLAGVASSGRAFREEARRTGQDLIRGTCFPARSKSGRDASPSAPDVSSRMARPGEAAMGQPVERWPALRAADGAEGAFARWWIARGR